MGEAALPLSPRLSARRSSSPRPGTTGSVWRNIHESTAALSPRAAATPRREDESVILAAKATAASNSAKSMAAHRDMLSARRRTRCFVNMARESTRPQINRPYSDAHPDTNYSPRIDDLSTRPTHVHQSHIHQRAPPRFGVAPSGSTSAYWQQPSGCAMLNKYPEGGGTYGISPAIHRQGPHKHNNDFQDYR